MGNSKNVWMSVIALACLAFAGWRFLGGKSGPVRMPDTYTGKGVCLSCKYDGDATYPAKLSPPFKCPSCEDDAFFLWWYCDECHYRFIPDLVRRNGQPLKPNPYPYCTHCNCKAVMGWNPEIPTHTPAGDAKLPKWP